MMSFLRFTKLTIAAGVIGLLLIAAIFYSVAFKQWCTQYDHAWGGTWGDKAFGDKLGECIRNKSLFEF